jgi:hypothetical protein
MVASTGVTTARTCRIGARALLGGLFVVSVYRAITQSVVFDEALTWELYIAGPFSAIFHSFSPNHHFLNTLLMRLSTGIFGVSEWSLRLPALAGAALYFNAVYRLARQAFGEGWTFLLAVALLSLNPFVLDFMVAARGYGMGLALWMWALGLICGQLSLPSPRPRELLLAGAALALSVTANLIFIPPAAALGAITAYFLLRQKPMEAAQKPHKQRHKRPQGLPPLVWFAAPIGGIAVLFLLLAPIEDMKADQFYTGAATIAESLRSLAAVSLQHSGPLGTRGWAGAWRDVVAFGIAPLILVGGLAVGLMKQSLLLILTAGSAVFSAMALLLIHVILGRPYPEDRTGIYFLPLVALVLIGLARDVPIAPYALGCLLLVQFATEFNTRKFLVWEYDADTRTMAEYIAAHRDSSAAVTRVGGSWQLQESLAFYGFLHQWTWLELTTRPAPSIDYYALIAQDQAAAMSALGLKELYRGRVSQSVLASVAGR